MSLFGGILYGLAYWGAWSLARDTGRWLKKRKEKKNEQCT